MIEYARSHRLAVYLEPKGCGLLMSTGLLLDSSKALSLGPQLLLIPSSPAAASKRHFGFRKTIMGSRDLLWMEVGFYVGSAIWPLIAAVFRNIGTNQIERRTSCMYAHAHNALQSRVKTIAVFMLAYAKGPHTPISDTLALKCFLYRHFGV